MRARARAEKKKCGRRRDPQPPRSASKSKRRAPQRAPIYGSGCRVYGLVIGIFSSCGCCFASDGVRAGRAHSREGAPAANRGGAGGRTKGREGTRRGGRRDGVKAVSRRHGLTKGARSDPRRVAAALAREGCEARGKGEEAIVKGTARAGLTRSRTGAGSSSKNSASCAGRTKPDTIIVQDLLMEASRRPRVSSSCVLAFSHEAAAAVAAADGVRRGGGERRQDGDSGELLRKLN